MVVFVTAAVSFASFAQKLDKGSASVSVEAPGWALINSTVHLSGASIPMGSKQVTLTIVDPSGKTNMLVAQVGSDGKYSADFKETNLVGMYAVYAVAPDKKGKADTTFIVSGPLDLSNHAVHKTVELLSKMTKGVPLLEQQVLVLPPSPAREEAMQRLEGLRASLQEGVVRA